MVPEAQTSTRQLVWQCSGSNEVAGIASRGKWSAMEELMESAEIVGFPAEQKEAGFDEFWDAYHSERRRKKSACRVVFEKITSPEGYHTRTRDKDSGQMIDIHLQATPEEIIMGAKAYYYQECVRGDTPAKFILHSTTFLNQGAWEDFDDAEAMANRLDEIRRRG